MEGVGGEGGGGYQEQGLLWAQVTTAQPSRTVAAVAVATAGGADACAGGVVSELGTDRRLRSYAIRVLKTLYYIKGRGRLLCLQCSWLIDSHSCSCHFSHRRSLCRPVPWSRIS